MTGRRLYDLVCDTRLTHPQAPFKARPQYLPDEMVAWPFLHTREKALWNELARRVTPRRKP